MANQFVKANSFRQNIVNKRSDPDYINLDEQLTDFRAAAISNNQVTQWYVILNECIYDQDESNFDSITYTSGEQTNYLVKGTDYDVNYISAVVTFAENLNPKEYTNLQAHYKGGGSIIWAEDITDLQKVIRDMDTNTVYTDGSNPMTQDFYMGSGTSENPYHSIKNVDTVDGIKVSRHNHTGIQTSGMDAGKDYGSPIPSAGIENNAIIEAKIRNSAVTNSKLSSNSVSNVKVQSNTLTADKLNVTAIGNGLTRTAGVVDDVPVPNAVLQTNIDNSSITFSNTGALQVPVILNLTGVVVPFAGQSTSVPSGWLLCDGSEYSNAQYPKLAQVLGTTYGGSPTTFKVPDFRNRTFWGGDASNVGTVKAAGIPNIAGIVASEITSNITSKWGAFKYRNKIGGIGNSGEASQAFMNFNASDGECGTQKLTSTSDPRGSSEPSITYSNKVYGKSSTVQPPAIQMMFIIKT
jgi:microcystin-dependent protein